jgi:dTDP-4-amino-4,6-dideoxygalactose transaminase
MIEYENLAKSNETFFENYKKTFAEFLESGRFVLGANVEKFEKEFAEYIGTEYCVGVGSGLDALRLALKSLEIEEGSEILAPSNTYIATIFPIIELKYKLVLVEPDIKTYNIDPKKIEEKISSKTRAIFITHLYGKCCEMDPILEIAKKHKLKIIEDCAQAHGSMYKGKRAGSFGDIGCFSFYPTKNLGALGEAGAITTDNPEIEKVIRWLRNYGSDRRYYNEITGYNSRLDEIQASLLRIKLRELNNINEHKRKLAKLYLDRLDKKKFVLPHLQKDFFDIYHIFNIRHSERDRLKDYLKTEEIDSAIHYPIPPHKQKAMKNIIFGEFPISEEIHNTTLSLPISYFHTEKDILIIIEKLNKFK